MGVKEKCPLRYTQIAYCYTVSILSQVWHHCHHLGSSLTPDLIKTSSECVITNVLKMETVKTSCHTRSEENRA